MNTVKIVEDRKFVEPYTEHIKVEKLECTHCFTGWYLRDTRDANWIKAMSNEERKQHDEWVSHLPELVDTPCGCDMGIYKLVKEEWTEHHDGYFTDEYEIIWGQSK